MITAALVLLALAALAFGVRLVLGVPRVPATVVASVVAHLILPVVVSLRIYPLGV